MFRYQRHTELGTVELELYPLENMTFLKLVFLLLCIGHSYQPSSFQSPVQRSNQLSSNLSLSPTSKPNEPYQTQSVEGNTDDNSRRLPKDEAFSMIDAFASMDLGSSRRPWASWRSNESIFSATKNDHSTATRPKSLPSWDHKFHPGHRSGSTENAEEVIKPGSQYPQLTESKEQSDGSHSNVKM